MFKKICGKCNQPSFSASETGKWICPICKNDLSDKKAGHASDSNYQKHYRTRVTDVRKGVQFEYKAIIELYI